MPLRRVLFLAAAAIIASPSGVLGDSQQLRAIWSTGHFSTISGPSGSEIGHSSGFAITDLDGNELFSADHPDGGAVCAQHTGRSYEVHSDCWTDDLNFQCTANFAGNPQDCHVNTQDGNREIGAGEGSTDYDFIGIAISSEGACVATFSLPDAANHCESGAAFEITKSWETK